MAVYIYEDPIKCKEHVLCNPHVRMREAAGQKLTPVGPVSDFNQDDVCFDCAATPDTPTLFDTIAPFLGNHVEYEVYGDPLLTKLYASYYGYTSEEVFAQVYRWLDKVYKRVALMKIEPVNLITWRLSFYLTDRDEMPYDAEPATLLRVITVTRLADDGAVIPVADISSCHYCAALKPAALLDINGDTKAICLDCLVLKSAGTIE